MSELVQIRQRIKAIETIQKITHAMRLIAMSAHSRLKKREVGLSEYIESLNALFYKVYSLNPGWNNSRIQPLLTHTKMLVILVGSQKGLCGNFNTQLFAYFTQYMARHPESTFDITIIGKKTADIFKHQYPLLHIKAEYTIFNPHTIFSLAQEISDSIIHAHEPYTSVLLFSNELKGFFVQRPQTSQLIPFMPLSTQTHADIKEGYLYQQPPLELLDTLAYQCLESRIQYLLFMSLHAEQAARFLSMDGATRNALTLLETNKLLYNKLRQAKITKELTELTASF
jgi:F-type H+-transporting ATPase subunit gamma